MLQRIIELAPGIASQYGSMPDQERALLNQLAQDLSSTSDETMENDLAVIEIMTFFLRLTKSRQCLEVTSQVSFITLALALAIPAGGALTLCGLEEAQASVITSHLQSKSIPSVINFCSGSTLNCLGALIQNGYTSRFDFAFVDVDPAASKAYYERTLHLLRPGGLMIVANLQALDRDNDFHTVPGMGRVSDLTDRLGADERTSFTMVYSGTGLGIILKE